MSAQRVLVFTDLVDSTAVTQRLGDAQAATMWSEHDRRTRELLARHRGREIDRSDGFFLLFEQAADAAQFAVGYHDALADLGLAARVGMHLGIVTLRENEPGDIGRGARPLEVDGLAKPLAARVMSLARGGQTLMTEDVRTALGAEAASHGHYRLKGIAEPVELFELGGAPGLPPADADKAYRVVRAGDVWQPVRDIRHNLPSERDAFVGRGAELRALAAQLDDGARLITVQGPGGTGKTRLVRRYGLTWLGDWPGGVYFCDLSETRSLEGIHFAVASALDVPLGRDDAGVQLGNAIAGRGRCLVILDNFEQVVEHAAATVGRWLDAAPAAAFIVTSRERLHLPGETIFPVEPLSMAEEAIELFATRARAQRPDFRVTDANRGAVAEVVRLLDGLPLAIELAAARIRMLSPAQLVERMRDRFALLAGARGAAARQATLHAAIDWSWDLLAPWEQAAFAQCAAFEGGFTLDAAEAVLDVAVWPEAPPVMDIVQALADKSLLRTWVPAGQRRYEIEEPHFGMYLSIHEYAAEKLAGGGGRGATEARHGRYFAAFGSDEALDALSRPGGVKRHRMLALELDNLVAACRHAVARGEGETAVAAFRAASEVLGLRGPFATAIALGEKVLAIPDLDGTQRASAAIALAFALRHGGRVTEAKARLDEALALVRAAGDAMREGRVLVKLGDLARQLGHPDDARRSFDAALALARSAQDRRSEGHVRHSLGLLDRDQGRMDEARAHFADALAIARERGDRREEGVVLGSLGLLHTDTGDLGDARDELEAALQIAREVGNLGIEGAVQANLAHLHSEQGNGDQARTHLETALRIHREVGNRRLEAIALGNLGPLYLMQGANAEALACCERALAIAREVGNRRHEAFLMLTLGMVHHDAQRLGDAQAAYKAGTAMARELGDPQQEGMGLTRLGQLHLEQGRLSEARLSYELALARTREASSRRFEGVVLMGIGRLLEREGRPADALASLRACEALLR
jgi:predicted ATPase/class 3 adenylate cyclase/Tfp pilus assembly protein PilF